MAAKTVQFWVDKFQLAEHPHAKGYYKATIRDSAQVANAMGEERSASTLIYFLHVLE